MLLLGVRCVRQDVNRHCAHCQVKEVWLIEADETGEDSEDDSEDEGGTGPPHLLDTLLLQVQVDLL